MKVWLRHPEPGMPSNAGVVVGPLTTEPADDAAVIIDVDRWDGGGPAAAWVVPSGLGGHTRLLDRLAITAGNVPVLLSVNGLGPSALAAAHDTLAACTLVHLFDARDQDALPYLEQLAWLHIQERPFAIMARGAEKLTLAAAFGAAHLLVLEAVEVDWCGLARLAAIRAQGRWRPLSADEVDHLMGGEASLTVVRPMRACALIDADDLDIGVTAERGLAPHLRKRIIGRRLRYDIQPGEPLNFGHLDERSDIV